MPVRVQLAWTHGAWDLRATSPQSVGAGEVCAPSRPPLGGQMKTIAEFAIRRRWFVIAGWLVLMIGAQGIAAAMGGSAYKDTFSLPHTETATVANLLKNAGQDNQNGASGTMVIKNTNNAAFSGAPPQLQPALAKLCASGDRVALISTPWQSIHCSNPGAVGAGNPKLLNTAHGSNTALVNITWQSNHYA